MRRRPRFHAAPLADPARTLALMVTFVLALPLARTASAASMAVSMPAVTAAPGATVDIPIATLPGPAGLGITSVDYRIGYAANVVQSVQVLSDGWLPTLGAPFVASSTTQLDLSDAGFAASTSALTVINTLRIVLKATAPVGTDMPLTFALFRVNEGSPTVALTDGVIHVRNNTAVPPDAYAGLALAPPAPSPAASGSRLSFTLASASVVRLEVYGLDGRRLRTLAAGSMVAGPHAAAWDLRDSRGAAVPAGLYLVRLTAGAAHAEQRLVVIH